MSICCVASCEKETITPNPESGVYEPSNPLDPSDPNNSDDPDDSNTSGYSDSDLNPTEYILSYQIDGVTYKMIRVDAPSDAPFRSFYMMETELPITRNIKFGSYNIREFGIRFCL